MNKSLSVVIPAYNEEKYLGQTLERIHGYLKGKGYKYEIIVIDDGSDDGTEKIARESAFQKESALRVISNGVNKGKGFSVRAGFREATGEYILFSDADLSTPIDQIEKLETAIDTGADIAIGSRSIHGSEVKVRQPLYRMMMGKIFNLFVQGLVMKGHIDTQCGFKLFKKECVERILPDLRISGFSFDVEMLYLARKNGYNIKEIPIVWLNSRDSKVRPVQDSARMFFDLLRIKLIHG